MTDPIVRPISVHEILEARGDELELECLNPEVDLTREVVDPDISSPGLALAGYLDRLPGGRMQVFGETEMTFLAGMEETAALERLEGLLERGIPAIFVTKGQEIPDAFVQVATRHGTPVLRSRLSTRAFFRHIKPFLEVALAPSISLHGSLADVYGVGVLFMGPSGIGKSECVLDLVERGHRLVADDLVICSQRGNDVLIGRGHELQRHHMEIRGIGLVDIRALFGIRAIRLQKRIEVVVHLERWDDSREYERTGLVTEEAEYLGVTLPLLRVPLNPGKNITVISEVVAMTQLVRYTGVDTAADFDRHLRDAMRPGRKHLEEDYE